MVHSKVLLNVTQLTVSTGDGKPVVDQVSLQVSEGEAVGILGGSGSGKSTTIRAIFDLLPRGLTRVSGRIQFQTLTLNEAKQNQWSKVRGHGMALIPQDPKSSLVPVLTIGKQMELLYRAHGKREHIRSLAIEALAEVKLGDPNTVLNAYPHELSGGMAQRVAIAMALIGRPTLLIADEPTTGLDVLIQGQILSLLRSLIDARGMALLLISHDLGVISHHTERLYVMRQSRVVEEGATIDVFANPTNDYTKELIEASTLTDVPIPATES